MKVLGYRGATLGRRPYKLASLVLKYTRSLPSQLLLLMLISLSSGISSASVVISEFMASNDSVVFDEDGDAEDWIELHNIGSAAVNLQNWSLSDDEDDLSAWRFPSITLAADEYLVVFASNKDRAVANSTLHTNFKLKAGGEYLALVMPDGVTIASDYSPQYPQQYGDISYGGDTYFPLPTPGTQNSTGVTELEGELNFSLAHGFFDSPQTLSLNSNLPNGEIRYTLDGSEPPSGLGCQAPADGKSWSYDYYEGNFVTLPDFSALTPTGSGTVDQVSTDVRARDENFALRFVACIVAPADGVYTFSTTSDDASQIQVGAQLVVDNPAAGATATVSNQVTLEAGVHEVVISYFQATGGSELSADWIAPLRGASYALTLDEGVDYVADAGSQDFVEFEFELPGDGQFSISARVRGPNGNADSFWVQLDDGPLWLYRIPPSGAFSQVSLNNDNVEINPSLSAGEHTIRFFVREDGAQIDSLSISALSCDGPCQNQTIEAEIETISGQFLLGGLDQEPIAAQGWLTYNAPIDITKTSTVRAIAVQENFEPSPLETQTYIFLDDVVLQSRNEENPAGWPAGNINGQDMDYGMDPEIVDPDPQAVKEALRSLPAISIVTEIDNLLHPNIGIYVNAGNRGRYWERPASIELIDPLANEPGFTIDAGIRVRGGFSRSNNNPKHPFRLYFRGSYDGDLEYPLFGDEGVARFERMDLRSPNNYNWAFRNSNRNTFLREIWSRDTQGALGRPYTRSRYYHLFINGQYWGVNMTQERVTKHYARSYFGGKKGDYDVVKHDNPRDIPRDDRKRYEASDGNNTAWNQIWDTVADETISASEYAFLDQQVDIDNLIDYTLGNAYEGDLDGATSWFSDWLKANNWYAVRDRENDRLKWSFFQHDGEHTLGARPNRAINEVFIAPHPPFNGQPNRFFSRNFMNPHWLHSALATNIEYQQRFIDRAAEVFAPGGVLSNEKGLERWLKRKAEVQPAILAHSARWGDSKGATPKTVDTWQNEVDRVENNVFTDRAEIVFAQLLDVGLASDIELPDLSIPSGSIVPEGTLLTANLTDEGTIYYTLDGSDPRAAGGTPSGTARQLRNGERLIIEFDTQLRIRVFKDGKWSAIIDADYLTEIEPPVLSIASGLTVPIGTRLNIDSPSPGNIYYTVDGSDPISADGMPSGAAIALPDGESIEINTDLTIGVRVLRDGRSSPLVSASYLTEIEAPVLSISSGSTVNMGTQLQITSPSIGDIYYTLDGADPLGLNGLPSGSAIALTLGTGVVIDDDLVLKARVFRNGRAGPLISAEYFVVDEVCFPVKGQNGNLSIICF